jgi:hypothetical protein
VYRAKIDYLDFLRSSEGIWCQLYLHSIILTKMHSICVMGNGPFLQSSVSLQFSHKEVLCMPQHSVGWWIKIHLSKNLNKKRMKATLLRPNEFQSFFLNIVALILLLSEFTCLLHNLPRWIGSHYNVGHNFQCVQKFDIYC